MEIGVVSEIAMTLVFEGKIEEASSYLLASNIAKFEIVRSSLKGNIESQLKISLCASMFLNTAFQVPYFAVEIIVSKVFTLLSLDEPEP